MGRLTLIVCFLTISVTAQAPAVIKVTFAPTQLALMQKIQERQTQLVQEYNALEQQKLIMKLRACMDLKMDTATCDQHDLINDGEGYGLRLRPKEEKK